MVTPPFLSSINMIMAVGDYASTTFATIPITGNRTIHYQPVTMDHELLAQHIPGGSYLKNVPSFG